MSTLRIPGTKAALAASLALSASLAGAAPIFDPHLQPFADVPPLALTGFNLSTGTQKAFQVWFDPNSWSGDLVAYPVGTDGTTQVSQKLWSAAAVFATKQACYSSSASGSVSYWDTGRKIVTRGGATPANIAFRWANLSAAEQASIGDATNGPKILEFIRGDRTNEKYQSVLAGDGSVQYQCGVPSPGVALFRDRGSILGDIVHGRPVFVGAPPADYVFDNYQAFKTAHETRAPRVYVGANDGMLHAFNADNGEEVWAYIPSMLLGSLKALSLPDVPYSHKYFVDGGITAGDVNMGSSAAPDWRTVLVGGLGAGGKGLYALDVTSPDAADENAAKAKILWEIRPTSAGYADLGNTYGTPVIARLNTGQWAAIVGNGYLNTNTGHAVLYIIDIATGALIKSLSTGSGTTTSPNGLSSPTAVDTNFDGRVDRVYAGDIDGNLWKFDISASSAGSWSAPTSPMISTARAIVGAPDVATHPLAGFLVYFATGRMFTPEDGADATTQNYAYGIWDGAPAANTALLEQSVTEKSYTRNGITVRVRVSTEGKQINWNDQTKTLHNGWRTALPPGERAIGTGFVRDARYHFASVNPNIKHTPPPNGENWLHELDFENGAAKDKPIFDLNSDSLLNDDDRVKDGDGAPVAGATGIPVAVYMGAGLLSQPVLAILSAQLSTTIFNDNPYLAPGDNGAVAVANSDPGVSGGHFDVDIYYGSSNTHTHEYDDKFDVTGVNFLNASDPVFNVSNAITDTSTKFKILIANQRLSPAVKFSVGGNPYVGVVNLQTSAGLTLASLPNYSRSDVVTLKFNMPKDAFKALDWSGTGDIRVGLQPTVTGCVRTGWPTSFGTTGPNGEYRNGALTFQLIKHNTPETAIELAMPGDPRYGYRLKLDATSQSNRLAEWTVFWHHPNGKCMGDVGWTQTPPMDTSASKTKFKLPAAGSEDPPRDEFGSVVNTEVTTVANTACSGCTIKTTVTTFENGWQLVMTQYIKSDGKITNTTYQYIPPPPGPAASDGGLGQSMSTPNTVTGYQQTRNTGKLGRITWHELFRN